MTSGGKHRNARSTAQEKNETQKKAENPIHAALQQHVRKAKRRMSQKQTAKEDGGNLLWSCTQEKSDFFRCYCWSARIVWFSAGSMQGFPVPWVITGYSCSRECGKSQDECHWPGAGAECLPVSVVQQAYPWSQIFWGQHCLGVFTYAGILVYICCYRMRSWNMDDWTKLSLVFDV